MLNTLKMKRRKFISIPVVLFPVRLFPGMEPVYDGHHDHLSHRLRECIELVVELVADGIQIFLDRPDYRALPVLGVGYLKVCNRLLKELNVSCLYITVLNVFTGIRRTGKFDSPVLQY